MSSTKLSYIEALGTNWPTVQASCAGSGENYEDLVWEAGNAMPSKQDMDTWILANTKTAMWKLIQVERDRRKAGGVLVSAINKWFHSDDGSRIQQLGLVMMGAGLPTGIMWKCMDGSFIEMSPTIAGAIFQSTAAKDTAIFTAAEQHRAYMNASSTPETYSYLTGWPAIFGE